MRGLILIKTKLLWNSAKRVSLTTLARIGILIIIILGAIYFSNQQKNYQEHLRNPASTAQAEQRSLIDKVGKLTTLPKDENPTIATVADISELESQQFFDKAKEGYKVLIFPKANRQILYDPSSNKIINDGQVNITPKN